MGNAHPVLAFKSYSQSISGQEKEQQVGDNSSMVFPIVSGSN